MLGSIDFFRRSYRGSFGEYVMLLELSDEGKVQSFFCSCHEGGEAICPHLQALIDRVTSLALPYHLIYQKSIWNRLFFKLSSEEEYMIEEKRVALFDDQGELLFSLESERGLTDWIEKFKEKEFYRTFQWGALSSHERLLYKQKRASPELYFELSWACELGKLLFLEKFDFSVEELNGIQWKNDRFKGWLALDKKEWGDLLPYLTQEQVMPPVFAFGEYDPPLIHYEMDKQRAVVHWRANPSKKAPSSEGVPLDGWMFWKHQGFWPQQKHPLMVHPILDKERLQQFLDREEEDLDGFFDRPICRLARSTFFHLWVDDKHHIHLQAYLDHPHDLADKPCALFGRWLFVPDAGFLLIEAGDPLLSFGLHTIIEPDQIDLFLLQHRHWIGAFPGFAIHLFQIEMQLSYKMEKGGLTFFQEGLHDAGIIFDLGSWIYVKGQGFFQKQAKEIKSRIASGMHILPHKLAHFLEEHEEELKSFVRFFVSSERLAKISFYLTMLPDGQLEVLPHLKWVGSAPLALEVFGRFLYLQDEGFLALKEAVPSRYFERVLIHPNELGEFLKRDFVLLRPLSEHIDPLLESPKSHRLILQKADPAEKPGLWVCLLWLETEKGRVSLNSLLPPFCQGDPLVLTKAGLLLLRENPLVKWLDLFRYSSEGKKDQITLSALQWMKVASQVDLHIAEGAKTEENAIFFGWLKGSYDPKDLAIDLTGFQSELRPYQQEGVSWLYLLYSFSLSGFLCDEMGLGKTHQAMGLIAAVLNAEPDASVLVVAPTSVIYHWHHLLSTFLPQRKVFFFHGRTRKRGLKPSKKEQIVLTSYGLLRSEEKRFAAKFFQLVIFDETQVAKNRQSQIYKSLQSISARTKIALTGTPFENHLGELKALFNLLLPGYLPSDDLFKERYSDPISRKDPAAITQLRQLIHPFILRRKKKDVLQQLPEKIEHKLYVELSSEQKELYTTLFRSRQQQLLEEGEKEGNAPFFTHVFALLTALKQICNHPALFAKDFNPSLHASEKWDFLFQLLEEAFATGQKVAIFSQYVEMLNMIAAELNKRSIGYAMLTGAVKDRKEQVDRFQTDPTCHVFLGSILAAGVGIDLTAASILVHYDRWWNPAKEEQATARIHRFGQTRGVQIYKLIAKNTIEEHLDQIIERKLTLYADLLEGQESGISTKLSKKELLHLLEELHLQIEKKF